MWISIFLKIIISFIIILLGHHIWIYLKDNFSVKKTKDLVGSQIQKYKTILNDIHKAEEESKTKEEELKLKKNKSAKSDIDQFQLVTYNLDSNSDYIDLKKDLEHFLQEIQ